MPLTAEQMADHLLNCETCREAREIYSREIQDHMESTKEDESCSGCGKNEHMKNCVDCRFKALKLHHMVSYHLKWLKFKKTIRNLFGLK